MAFVVVFGAGGRLGRRVSAEAADRGHCVIGVVHHEAIPCSARESRRSRGASSISPPSGAWPNRPTCSSPPSVARQVRVPRRGAHPGGCSPGGGRTGPPDRPEALGQAAALDHYRTTSGVDWVYLSPPPGNFEPGDRTGPYRVGDDHPVVDAQGRFGISYEDYAVALVDEIDHPRYHRQRFTVGY